MTKRRTCVRSRAPALLLGAAIGLCSPAACAGENDTIVTDRPDVVESSNVVGKGRFQIETSLARERNDSAGVRERIATTPTLLRYGLTDSMEVRIETDGHTVLRAEGGATVRGMADLAVGAKWHLADGGVRQPSLGLLFHVDLPSGARALRGAGWRPSLRLVAEWELPGEMSLGLMPGIILDKDAQGRRYPGGILAIVAGKTWTEQFRTFAELSLPHIAAPGHGGTQAAFNLGAAYLLTRQVQIDTALSHGLNRRTTDLSSTVGLSVKF